MLSFRSICRLLLLAGIATAASAAIAPARAGDGSGLGSDLDRVAYAVDGAESSHGRDLAMWRPQPAGPQGPMQVSARAATDVGGGDRFDVRENRALGRAYLAQLYRRYGNWADAIAAYNWGIGNLDKWIKAGRPPDKLLSGVALYLRRVLRDSGLCGPGTALEDCAARLLGPDGAVMRAALAGSRLVERGPGPLHRQLAAAEALARQFGAQQVALDRRLSARP
jgi:Transglycosylase SLT domain